MCKTNHEKTMPNLAISFADIVAAHERIKSVAHRTQVMTSTTADALTQAKLFFKCENFQRMGAFKFRGAYNAIAQFSAEQRRAGVIAFSSGNHAQGIALAAKLLGVPALIVMPQDAPEIKINATRGYGAEIVLFDRYNVDREALTRGLAAERGMTLIPPYDHAHVMAGAGTVAKELIEDTADSGPLDMLLVCLGGGGLLSGCAVAAKTMNPGCVVIGVEPEAGNDGQQSFRAKKMVRIEVPKTIADGAQTQSLGALTFPIISAWVDDIVTVSDAELVDAMKFAASRMKMIVEPTGCLAIAAALYGAVDVKNKRVGVIVSGGNVDMVKFAQLVA
jgi:threo-3-hydroxy-L-aspartate ammonia-lyase